MDKIKKMLGFFMGLVFAAVAAGGIYAALVLLEIPGGNQAGQWVVEEEKEAITPLQSADLSDGRELARIFGAPLPIVNGMAFRGEARNVSHDGALVRQATLFYEGFTVTAVRPASAAALLLYPQLSVSLRSDLSVLNLPVTLASSGEQFCAYFADGDAAYAVYAPQATERDFLLLLERLTSVH